MEDRRLAGHGSLGPNGELIVDDGWDHELLVLDHAQRMVSENAEGLRIVYADRVFHVSAALEKPALEAPHIAFAPCECGAPPKRQREL
jgi:hypothetical protein